MKIGINMGFYGTVEVKGSEKSIDHLLNTIRVRNERPFEIIREIK